MRFSLAMLALLVGGAAAGKNATSSDFTCNCKSSCCTYIPSDGNYYLTSFCDGSTACGQSCGNCNWAYATSAMRFGCNKQLRICKGSKCVTAKVIDSGPACWVEENAGRSIIDASYSVCKYFTGGSSCGWSDRVSINARLVSAKAEMPDHLLGPCALSLTAANAEKIPMCPSDEDTYLPQ